MSLVKAPCVSSCAKQHLEELLCTNSNFPSQCPIVIDLLIKNLMDYCKHQKKTAKHPILIDFFQSKQLKMTKTNYQPNNTFREREHHMLS